MKKHAIIIIGFVAFLFTGCNKTVPLQMETITVSDKTEEWEIDIAYTRFLSTDDKVNQSCNKMNQEIQQFVDSLHTDFKDSANVLSTSLKDVGRDMADLKCTLIIKDSVFIADNRYISVRFETYSFLGGANGLNRYFAFNYDIKNQRFLLKEDIFDANSQVKINNLLEENFENPFSCFDGSPSLENVTAVNITSNGIFFTYDQYVLGPRVCGSYTTFIPKDKIHMSLKLKDL